MPRGGGERKEVSDVESLVERGRSGNGSGWSAGHGRRGPSRRAGLRPPHRGDACAVSVSSAPCCILSTSLTIGPATGACTQAAARAWHCSFAWYPTGAMRWGTGGHKYREVAPGAAKPGDVVVYFDENGKAVHSAREPGALPPQN